MNQGLADNEKFDEGSSNNRLFVPEASSRPEAQPSFDMLEMDEQQAHKPPLDICARDSHPFAHGLIRVLDDDGRVHGSWAPELSPDILLAGLEHMVHVRAYDDRMFRMQRQGQLSFYMKCTGEEAVAVAQAMALDSGDMLFPSYRQQGLLFVRKRPVVDMMCACISNSKDNLKGRQMPVFYGWAPGNYFTISGNLATQYSQSVGWAMASAYKGESHIAAAWVGDGATAEGDVHYAMQFAATYKAPVILNIVNNQWAISTPQSFASTGTTFATRGLGYNIPSLRVDGNDFLAVYSVTKWAADRARQGFGPTVVELVTYRKEGHSTSDNPSAYRSEAEAEAWPLGDPIERLKQHLILEGVWSEEQHQELQQKLEHSVRDCWKEAIRHGTLENGPHWPVESIFDDVFADIPPHLEKQKVALRKTL